MMNLFPTRNSGAAELRSLLASPGVLQVPGCFDALSARIIEQAGFKASFLGGFSMSAHTLALPDVGLLSFGEMIEQARKVCLATNLPVIGDADTGYGNAINSQRTLLACAQAGIACVMIEDQQWPKRCGHTEGKSVVERVEAVRRIRACVRAREAAKADILIMARTDAAASEGFEEALWRTQAFADEGADITFLEAPESVEQMERYCQQSSVHTTANLVEDGKTPWRTPAPNMS